MFEAVLKIWRSVALRRNDFAHNLWGTCEELPDAMCLMDPKHDNAFRLKIFQELERVKKGQKRKGIGQHDPTRIQVWTADALLSELISAPETLANWFLTLAWR